MAIRTMKSDDNDVSTQGTNPNVTQTQPMPATLPPTVVRPATQTTVTPVPNTTDPDVVRSAKLTPVAPSSGQIVARPAPTRIPDTPQANDRGVGIDNSAIVSSPGLDNSNIATEQSVTVAYAEDLSPWFKEDKWPQSAWLTRELGTTNKMLSGSDYDQFVIDNLRWRYLHLETDFRSALNNFYNSPYFDKVIARRIINLLQTAQQALDQASCDPLNVKSLLDIADENMPWIFPPHYAKAETASMIADLKNQHNMWGTFLENELNRDGQTLGGLRAAMNMVKEQVNAQERDKQISNGLQIDRLRMLINYGVGVLILMLIGLPLFINYNSFSDPTIKIFSDTFIGQLHDHTKAWQWLAIASFAAIGAIGSFLSGLLQIRRSHVTLSEYKESMVQFKLRPIVGALIASLAAVLLITKVSGVSVDGVGGFLLIIFICGFSERYFLNLFKINDDSSLVSAPQQAPTVDLPTDSTPPPAPPSSAPDPNTVRPRKAVDSSADVNTRKL